MKTLNAPRIAPKRPRSHNRNIGSFAPLRSLSELGFSKVMDCIDVHTEGEQSRIVVRGAPKIPGRTMLDKMVWLNKNGGDLRRYLLHEPRGSLQLFADLVLPSSHPKANFGIIILGPDAYASMSGTNVICSVTAVLESGILPMKEPYTYLTVEVPAGLVKVKAECSRGKCRRVHIENVPSFATALDQKLKVPGLGVFKVDIAFGGLFCAFVDVSRLGFKILPKEAGALARVGEKLRTYLEREFEFVHPLKPGLNGLSFVALTAPPRAGGHARSTVVIKPGYASRTPAGTGTSARLAILSVKNQIKEGEEFIHEGMLDTHMRGKILGHTREGSHPAVIPNISARGWITGLHQLGLDRSDVLGKTFQVIDF